MADDSKKNSSSNGPHDKSGNGAGRSSDYSTKHSSDDGAESEHANASLDRPTDRPTDRPSDPLTEAKSEAEKFKNEYLYLRAEFENFKRQAVKERSDLRKYGAERLVTDLLSVLDIFETALSTELSAENVANFKKGIELTSNELRSVLQRHGVAEVPSNGAAFDPTVHEALSSQETNDVEPGTITQVFKKPYKLHDRIVRPGQVVVARPKS
jgi:molecular chaperone GrpE